NMALDNVRSQLSGYNALDQLVGAQGGSLMADPGPPALGPGSLRRSDAGNLDVLGNWNGNGTAAAGRATQVWADGTPSTKSVTDLADRQNRIDNRTIDTGSTSGPE